MCRWIITLSFAVFLLFAAPAFGETCEPEVSGPSPTGADDLAELEPNPERAALALNLGGSTSDSDDVTLATKDQKSLASNPSTVDPDDATTDVRSSPRTSNDKLEGNVVTSATPRRGGSTVTVNLCVDSANTWQAGTYSGTVTIDGPRLQAFAYPLVINKKWPFWTALVVLLAVVIGYVIYAWARGQDFAGQTETGGIRSKLVYYAVAAVGGLLVYWSVYVKSETWGANPAADIPALALAGLTGAIAGGTAARAAFAQIGSTKGAKDVGGREAAG